MQLPLDLELDGQAVRIPAGLPFDVEALHRLVAAEKVFEGSREDVVRARLSVGGGRAFVKDEAGAALPDLQRLLEGLLVLPLLLQLRFERGEADLLVHLLKPDAAWRGLALGHLVFQTCVVGRFRLGRAGRPAVPPRFPRQSPRTLLGLRLGSDLDTGLGRRALSFARLSVDRGGRAYPSPSTSLIAKFYRSADAADGRDDEEDHHRHHQRRQVQA